MKLSQQDLASILGVAPRTIRDWHRAGLEDAARGSDGQYDVTAAIAWWGERRYEEGQQDGTDDDPMERARLRKLEADAESKELDLAKKRGDLVPLDEVEDLVRESLETVNSVLRHAPSRFAPKLAKLADVPLKQSRTILEDVVEMCRASVRERDQDDES